MASGFSYKTPAGGAELRKSGVGNNAKPKASTKGGVGRDTATRVPDPGPQSKPYGGDEHTQRGFKGKGIL
jgi:hypothetical protein